MKQTLLTLILIFVCLCNYAQNPCTPIGEDRCINAPLINSCQLNGWYSNTDPPGFNYTDNDDIQNDPGWCNGGFTIENNQWLRFTAIEDHLHIEVDVSECEAGNGIQMGAYELVDQNGRCPGNQINCFGLASGANTSLIFEINNLTPGTQYLLMIDGWAGDGCPFLLYISSGIPLSVEVEANPLPICPGVPALGALNAEITEGGGSSVLYGWSTENGNIVSGDFDLNPIIDEPGDYTFTAYNVNTCCWASETVTVTTTTELPLAVGSVVEHINCLSPTATVTAEGSVTDNGFNVYEYLWTFPNGNPAGEGFILEGLLYPGIYILTVRNVSTGCESQIEVEVLEDFAAPDITLLNPPILDCIDTTIFLSVDAPIGSTFEWSNTDGFTSVEQAPLIQEPGIYNVTVTGANGCTSDSSIEVTDDTEIPLVQVVAPTLDCANPSAAIIVLNDNDETVYSWNGPSFVSDEQSPIISSAGTYFLSAINPNGCEAEYLVQVDEDITPPEIAIDPADILDCNLIAFTLSSSSPNEIVSYQWSGPNPFNSIEDTPLINEPGTYSLIVTDDKGCTNLASIDIEDNLIEPQLDLNPDGVLTCANLSVNLDGQSNDEIVAYEWSDDLGSESMAEVTEAGTYFVTITGTNGCTSISQVDVEDDYSEPTPDAGMDAIITCAQSETTLQGSGSSINGSNLEFEWSLNGNVIGEMETISVSATGIYQLMITDLENGCTAMDEVEVGSDENLPQVVIEDVSTLNCNTANVLLSGINSTTGNDISYMWLDANQNIISNEVQVEVNNAGAYTFVVTNNTNGCESELPIQVIEDFILPDPIVDNQSILNCIETNITVDAENQNADVINISYQWFDADSGQLIGQSNSLDISNPGNYNLVATNLDNGCISEHPFPILENIDTPIADAGAPFTITCNDTEAPLSAVASQGSNLSFEWFDSGGNLVSDQAQTSTDIPGQYSLIVTNTESGCIDEALVNIDINADFPEIMVNEPTVLNCTQPTTGLDASNSIDANNSQGTGNLSYAWYDENNNLISNEPVIEVDLAGEYTLVLIDTNSDCEVSMPIQVTDDFEEPFADAGPAQIITCDINFVMLDGSNSTNGDNYFYRWLNSNNVVVGDGQMIEVSNPDTYTLVVSNIISGCSSSANVEVTPDENIPMAEVDNDGILSCTVEEVNVFSSLEANPNYSYTWQNEYGEIISEDISFVTQESGVYMLTVLDERNGCSNTTSILVEENFAIPDLSANIPDVINCIITNSELISTLGSTSSDVSYTWQNENGTLLGTQATLSVSEAGVYYLTAVDNESGCEETINVEVIDNFEIEEPTVAVSNIIDCVNQDAQLVADGISNSNYTYSWYDSEGNLVSEETNHISTLPGTYDLIVTNQLNGCTAATSATVEEDILIPTLSIPPAEVLNCVVLEVTLIGQSSQDPNFTYNWTDEQGNSLGNNLELEVSEPGEYTLNILNNENGCTNNSLIEVIQNINSPEAIIDDLAPLGLSCTQESVILDGGASTPIGNVQYEWYDPAGNLVGNSQTYEASNPGEYQLLITDLTTQCISQSLTLITQNDDVPLANIAPPEILNCNTSFITLDAGQSDLGSEFTYAWDIPTGAVFDDNNILSPTTSTPGTYIITVVNTSTGCENQYEVEVLDDFEEPIAQANAEDELDCVTSQVQINALGSSEGSVYSYSWNIDGVIFTDLDFVSVQNPGEYSLIVTNIVNGCTKETTVNVLENTDQPTDFAIVNEDITCFGDNDGFFQVNEVIGGTAPYIFTINGESFEELPSAENLSSGNYPLLVTDALGCTLETSIDIVEPPQVFVELSEDITINLGETAYLNANSNVEQIDWYSVDSLDCIDNCFNQQVSPYVTTLYEVEVMDENGCPAVADVVVHVQFDRAVYIPNVFSPNGDGLNDYFRVFGNSAVLQVKSMLIADRWGEIVFEAENILLEEEQKFWDGVHRGEKMNDDVLVYYVVVEYIDGLTESFKGDVTLIR